MRLTLKEIGETRHYARIKTLIFTFLKKIKTKPNTQINIITRHRSYVSIVLLSLSALVTLYKIVSLAVHSAYLLLKEKKLRTQLTYINFMKKSYNVGTTCRQSLSTMAHLIAKNVSNAIESLSIFILTAVGGLLYVITVSIVLYPYSKTKRRTIGDILSQIQTLTIGDLYRAKYAQSVTREILRINMPKELQGSVAGPPGAGSVSHTTPKSMK